MIFELPREEPCAICGAVAHKNTPNLVMTIVYCPNYTRHDGEAVQGVWPRDVISEWNRIQRARRLVR